MGIYICLYFREIFSADQELPAIGLHMSSLILKLLHSFIDLVWFVWDGIVPGCIAGPFLFQLLLTTALIG